LYNQFIKSVSSDYHIIIIRLSHQYHQIITLVYQFITSVSSVYNICIIRL
ncbi:hypothetical protein LOTGIDRAFT_111984, partial [Lottia gigantea]